MSAPHTWASLAQSRLIVCTIIGLLAMLFASAEAYAVDAGQAAMSCARGPQFNASNSAKKCVDLGKNPNTGECRVGLLATGGGYITFNSYDCSQTCNTRLDGQAGMINGTLYSGGVCNDGCKMQPNLSPSPNFSLREGSNPNAISIRSGTWKASGDICYGDLPPQPEKKDEFCHTTSSGHRVCKSEDRTCVSSASGFRTCASDSKNTKGHTETNKSRTEAAAIGAPNTPPNAPSNRPGENWQPSGGNTSITNNNTGSTTNNMNFSNQGTPNGNDPVPGDGSGPGTGGSNGGGGEGEGEGQGDNHGTVGGDGECTGSFTCTGGDPVLCAIAQQSYKARCEASTRFGDGEGEGVGTFPGDGDGGAGPDPDPKKSITSVTPGLGMIDKGGFWGGGSCPAFEVASTKYGVFSFNESSFCQVLPIARGCFLFLGAFIALGIVMGWGARS